MSAITEMTVGQLATEHPLSTRVFARHGIDYCCGGGRTLEEVCAAKGLDAAEVLAQIEKEIGSPTAAGDRWDQLPLGKLIDHILAAYHRPLDEELPRLDAMAAKVLKVHGSKDPERLGAIHRTFVALRSELEQHMAKEEQVLFPMIRAGQGGLGEGPVSVMRQEHELVGGMLLRLRELTDDYEVPAAACNTWRALWHGLAALEADLHEHIHLENNILFPRALGSN